MQAAIDRVMNYMEGKSLDDLAEGSIAYYGIVKNIEIIGEAAALGRHCEDAPCACSRLLSDQRARGLEGHPGRPRATSTANSPAYQGYRLGRVGEDKWLSP